MTVAALKPRNTVESLRDVVQDLLVPELKAIKTDIHALRTEMSIGIDSVRSEMRLRDENQTARANHITESIRQLSDKIDNSMEIRSRLAVLEDRLPRN